MKTPLRILHLEDDSNDAALVQAALNAGEFAYELTLVNNRADFFAAVGRGGVDLLLSDYAVPGYDGVSAVGYAREHLGDVPVILVSGTLGEELAIESLKSGATDYVLKGRLSRLVPALQRAMKEVEAHRERARLEAQFIEAQKMEVIGHLASGVAHDFNNILAVIMGYTDLMLQELPADTPVHEHAERVRHAAERACGLTRQLLVFSRGQTVQAVVLDLNETVSSMNKMLRRLVDENISLSLASGKDLGRIKADSGYIGQVLMNLVVNARDAMPNGGHLSIETSNVTVPVGRREPDAPASMPAGAYVMMSVADTGTGMTDEIKARVFEAFFTTKPKGKGTGLGLATCQTIVKQCGGYIGLSSQPGQGTTFRVYFPRVDAPLDATAHTSSATAMPHGAETLLLVEDEPSVRHLARDVLHGLGYNVLTASNGQDGLNVARAHKDGAINLVITDVVMPQMGGRVMAEWLKATYPHLKILYTSGYTDDAISHHGVLDSEVAFLPKPYSPSVLAQKVREMLDTPVPGETLEPERAAAM